MKLYVQALWCISLTLVDFKDNFIYKRN